MDATGFGGVVAKFGADVTDFSTGIRKMTEESASFASHLGSVTSRAASGFVTLGRSIISGIGGMTQWLFYAKDLALTLGRGVAGFFSYNGAMEQTRIAFVGLLGSAKEADAMLRRLQDFAARTPFEFPDLAKNTQMLVGMGVAAKDVIPWMTAIGDAAAGIGSGKQGVESITRALGQMEAKTKISGEEMMQLTEAGIPAWRILAQSLGLTVAQVQDLSQKGELGADAINKLVAGMERMYSGQMKNQATTFNGLLSTLHDNAIMALQAFAGPLFASVKKNLATLTDLMGSPQILALATNLGKLANEALTPLIDRLMPAVGWMLQLAVAVGKGDEALRTFSPTLADVRDLLFFLEPVFAMLSRIGGDLSPIFENLGRALFDIARSTVASVFLSIQRSISAMEPYLRPIADDFSTIVQLFVEMAGVAVARVFDALASSLSVLGPTLVAVADNLKLIAGVFTQVAAAGLNKSTMLVEVLTQIAPLLPPLVDAFGQLASVLLRLAGTALDEGMKVLELTLEAVLPPAIQLATVLLNVASAILDFLSPAIRPLVDGLLLLAGGFLAVKAAQSAWDAMQFVGWLIEQVRLLPTAIGLLALQTVEVWNNVRAWLALKATQIGSFFSGLVALLPGISAGLTGAGTAAGGAAVGFGALNVAMLGVVGVVGLVAGALVGLGVVIVTNVQQAHDHAAQLATDLHTKWVSELEKMNLESPQVLADMRDKMFLELVRTGAMTREQAWQASENWIAEAKRGSAEGVAAWKNALDSLAPEVRTRLDTVTAVYQRWIDDSNGTWAKYWEDFKNQAINAQSLWAQSVERGLSQEQQNEIDMMTRHADEVERNMGQWGADQVIAYATGMTSQEVKVLDATERIGTIISERLAHSSPTAGPLVGDNRWMPDFVTMLADGIATTSPVLLGQLNTMLTLMQDRVSATKENLLSTFSSAWEGVRGGLVSGWNGITGALLSAADRMIYVLNQGLSSIESFVNNIVDAVDWIAGKLGAGSPLERVNVGRITYLARGTDSFEGGMAMVGERGRELVYLPRGSQVLPNERTEQLVNHGNTRRIPGFAEGTDITSVFDFIMDWLSGGVSRIADKLFKQFNVGLSLPGVLSSAGPKLLSQASGWVGDYVGKLIEKTFGTLNFAGGLPVQVPYGNFLLPPGGGFHQQYWYGIHQGMDLQFPQGSPLREVIGGMVWPTTGWKPWGGEVDVKTAMGLTERYEHLSQIAVAPGQFVRRGDFLGLSGGGTPASGLGYWSTGAHLHYQVDTGSYNTGINPLSVWAALGLWHPFMFGQGGVINEPVMGAGLYSHRPYVFGENGPERVTPLGAGGGGGGSRLDAVLERLERALSHGAPLTEYQVEQALMRLLANGVR